MSMSNPDLLVSPAADARDRNVHLHFGDKSISHRALFAAALTPGPTNIAKLNLGSAVTALLEPFEQLGVHVSFSGNGRVTVSGLPQSHEKNRPILDVGPSSAAARLLIGMLVGIGREAIVDGSEVLRTRPMDWVVEPLRELGASIEYLGKSGCLPVLIKPSKLHAGRVKISVGSAQARSAVVMGAVCGGIDCEILYPVLSRNHTELLFQYLGANIKDDGLGRMTVSRGSLSELPDIVVPGDPSLVAYPAAFHMLCGRQFDIQFTDVCLNRTRTGFLDIMRKAGANIQYRDIETRYGEEVGTVVVGATSGRLNPILLNDKFDFHAAIDEIPLLCAVAATANGRSEFHGLDELIFKETDRIHTTVAMLRSFGADVCRSENSILIEGGRHLHASVAPSFDDHRIAMSACVLASATGNTVRVEGGGSFRTSFPDFIDVMEGFGCPVRVAAE